MAAFAPDCEQNPRLVGIEFDLLAQARDSDVDAAVARVEVAAMREVAEAIARQHLARMIEINIAPMSAAISRGESSIAERSGRPELV
jgi:hypothetical protein